MINQVSLLDVLHPFVSISTPLDNFDLSRWLAYEEEPYWNWWNTFVTEINKGLALIGMESWSLEGHHRMHPAKKHLINSMAQKY